jgi:hypothetical protein
MKDHVLPEERRPIQAKGISKPVRNYAVIAPIEDLVAHGRAIHEDQDGLRRRLVLSLGEGKRGARTAETMPVGISLSV